MPIISGFQYTAYETGGMSLSPATNILTLAANEKAYIKWTDPEDIGSDAVWSGTLLVRKAGSAPSSRSDGVIVLDSKTRNAYADTWFCDSGLTNGVVYYYKLFPYTSNHVYTNSQSGEICVTPNPTAVGNVSGMATFAAGNGKLALKWTEPPVSVTDGEITLAEWESTTVVVKENGYADSPNDADAAFTYKSVSYNAHSTKSLTATGLKNGITYYISFFPASSSGAVNTNEANRITGVPNRMYAGDVPYQVGALTYNGAVQSPSWSHYTDAQFSTGGVKSAIDAGTYSAIITPTDDWMWGDGSTDGKSVAWSIRKAAGTLSVDKSEITLSASNLSETIAVSRAGDGAVSAISSDTSVATVSVSDSTGTDPVVTITHVNQTTGTAAITISVADGTNYSSPGDKTVAVSAQFDPSLPAKKALNDMTWAEISQVSDAGLGSEYWSVGDRKAVLVNGTVGTLAVNQTLYVYILGFNHNSAKEGSGIHFGTFKTALSGGTDVCLVDSNYGTYKTNGTKLFSMNHWGTISTFNYNYGGWKACDIRYDILGSTRQAPRGYGAKKATSVVGYDAPANTATSPVANTLIAALPNDLRAVMKPITKYTDNKGNSSDVAANVTASVDYLPLLAEFEVFGSRYRANQHEQNSQVQYDYYKAGNSKVKYSHSETDSTAVWHGRSPVYDSDKYFFAVHPNAISMSNISGYSYGLAPVFMV